jgi:hypothetical protein
VEFRDAAHDGKPQTGAAGQVRARRIDAVEALEYAIAVGFGDPPASIFNRHDCGFPLF